MLPSEQRLVEEVIQRIDQMDGSDPDSLDRVEIVLELREEFGTEAVTWAFRFLEAKRAASDARASLREKAPLWDRDLDR
jgi:hypothetical protein